MDRLHDDAATCVNCHHNHEDPHGIGFDRFRSLDPNAPEPKCGHQGCECKKFEPIPFTEQNHVTCSMCGRSTTRFFTSCWGGGPLCDRCHGDD